MYGIWLIVALGILGAIAAMTKWTREQGGQTDLGTVSQKWLAEHSFSEAQHPS